jgi:hypothetical protein
MHGYRNFSLGIVYMGVSVYFASIAPDVSELGPTLVSLGLGVTGVITGRAVNKWAERNGKEGTS